MSSHAEARPVGADTTPKAAAPARRTIPYFNTRTRPLDLQRLCQQWQCLQSAGIAPQQALPDLADAAEPTSKPLATAIDAVVPQLHQGATLSAAFTPHRKVVGENFLAALELGERMGVLDVTLGHLARFFQDVHKSRRNLKSLIAEPIIFSLFAIGAAYSVIVWAVPEFEKLYQQAGSNELPWPTRFLITLSGYATSPTGWLIAALIAAAIAAAFVGYYRSDRVRFTVDRWSLKIPGFGGLILSATLGNAFRSMALSWKSGGGSPESIRRGASAASNLYVRDRINFAAAEAGQGRSVEDCFRNTDVIPGVAISMVRAGERSGRMPELLDSLANQMMEDVDYYRDRIKQFMDPAMKVVFGGIALFMMLAIFMPMWSFVDTMSKTKRPDPNAAIHAR